MSAFISVFTCIMNIWMSAFMSVFTCIMNIWMLFELAALFVTVCTFGQPFRMPILGLVSTGSIWYINAAKRDQCTKASVWLSCSLLLLLPHTTSCLPSRTPCKKASNSAKLSDLLSGMISRCSAAAANFGALPVFLSGNALDDGYVVDRFNFRWALTMLKT